MTANASGNKRLPGAGSRISYVTYEYVFGGECWDTGDGACNAALRVLTPRIVGIGRSGYAPVLPPGKWIRDHSVLPSCRLSFEVATQIASFRWKELRQEADDAKFYLTSRYYFTRWSQKHRPQWNTLGPVVKPYVQPAFIFYRGGVPQKRFKGRGWAYRVRW